MNRLRQCVWLLGLLGALCIAAFPRAARAQLFVTPTVINMGTFFTYNYTITNASASNFSIISFAAMGVQNPQAPPGFQTIFDPGVNLVSFLGGEQGFAPGSTTSGFSFNSIFSSGTVTFEALDENGNTTTGTTLSPVGAAIPEPGTLALALSLAPGLALWRLRRRNRAVHGSPAASLERELVQ